MQDGGFQKVGQTEKRLYGPRRILLCGYPADDRNRFRELLNKAGLPDITLIAADTKSLTIKLKELFAQTDKSGTGGGADMQRAAIMAGITEKELHTIINAYRAGGLPPQFWATLTPISENWQLGDLLQELEKENAALRQQRQSTKTA